MSNHDRTVVFDFDGVIHSYTSGWQGMDIISDPPQEDVVLAIKKLRESGYTVTVVSTRCSDSSGLMAIMRYLMKHNIVVDEIRADKPPALVYVDDRALRYEPNMDLFHEIISFKTWRG